MGTLAATCRSTWKHLAGLDIYADGLALGLTENGLEVRVGTGPPQRHIVDPDAAKTASDLAFVHAVLGDSDDVGVSYDEALRTHRLACAVARSATRHSPFRLEGTRMPAVTGSWSSSGQVLHAAAELRGTNVASLADGVRGRRVAVTGAGVVGLLTAMFARYCGAIGRRDRPHRTATSSRDGTVAGGAGPASRRPAVVLKRAPAIAARISSFSAGASLRAWPSH